MGFVLPSAACNCSCSSLSIAKRARRASPPTANLLQSQAQRSTGSRKPFAPSLQDPSSVKCVNRQRIHTVRCAAQAEPPTAEQSDEGQQEGEAEEGEDEAEDDSLGGYTPAEFVYYSEDDKHLCFHELRIVTETPVEVCFNVWDDWRRLVDFLDLIAQIGLDPHSPDMGLFQCFYRWGQTPILELTFILQKIEVVSCERILFKTVWGMPLAGIVEFKSLGPNRTETRLQLRYRLPEQLADFVGRIGVEGHVHEILNENFAVYKKLVEGIASGTAQPPREPVERSLAGCPKPDTFLRQAAMEEYVEEELEAAMEREAQEAEAQAKADEQAEAAAAAADQASTAPAEPAAPPDDHPEHPAEQPLAAVASLSPSLPDPSAETAPKPRGRGRRTQQVPLEPAAASTATSTAAPPEAAKQRRRTRLVPSSNTQSLAAAPSAAPATPAAAPVAPKQRRRTSAASGGASPAGAAAAAPPAEAPQASTTAATQPGSNGQAPKQRRRTAAATPDELPQASMDGATQPGSNGQAPKQRRRTAAASVSQPAAAGAPARPPQAGTSTPVEGGSFQPAPARTRRTTQGRKPTQSAAQN